MEKSVGVQIPSLAPGEEMKSKFGSLLKTELKNSLGSTILLLALIIIWDLFLYTRQNSWDKTLIFILSFLPIIFLPFYALVSGFYMLNEEWRKKTIAQLLSLPVKGITLTSVKLLTVGIETVVFIIMVFIGVIIFSKIALLDPLPIPALFQLGTLLLIITVLVTVLSQFAYLVGRVFRYLQWLVSLWTFLLAGWVIIRYSGLLAPYFSFVPNFQLNSWFLSGIWQYLGNANVSPYIKIHGPTATALLLSFLLIFFLGSWILENYVEMPVRE